MIPQPKSVEPPIEESEYWKYKSININNADNVTVEGITVTNAAFHTFNLVMIQYWSIYCLFPFLYAKYFSSSSGIIL